MGRIHGADAALPGRLHVDAVGEPVALQLADHLELRGAVHHLGADQRGAVGHNDAVDVANTFHQLSDGARILIRPKRDPSLQLQPLPVRDRRQPVQVLRQQARIAHPLGCIRSAPWLGNLTCRSAPHSHLQRSPALPLSAEMSELPLLGQPAGQVLVDDAGK